MSGKFIKKCTSVFLSAILLSVCVPSAFAVTENSEMTDTNSINQYLPTTDYKGTSETPVSTNPVITEPFTDDSVDTEETEVSNDKGNIESLSYYEDKDKFISGDIVFRTIGDITFEELFPEFNISEIAEIIPVIYWISPFVQYDNVYCIRFDDPHCNESNEAISIIESRHDTELINTFGWWETPVSTEPVIDLKGDADGDGKLSIADVTYIQKYLAGLITENEIDCKAANISGTGTISIDDSTDIQKKLAGIDIDW